MSSTETNHLEFKALGIIGEGEFRPLLESAVSQHLYGTLELTAEETTSLTFIDGYVVLEPGDIPNRAVDRQRMSEILQGLLDGDGFVGRYRFGVIARRSGVHELARFNPLALAGAGSNTKNPERRPPAMPVIPPPVKPVIESKREGAEAVHERRKADDALFDSARRGPERSAPLDEAEPNPNDETSEKPSRRTALRRLIRTLSA